MRLIGINLQNFRNLNALSLEFTTDRVFFLGSNGQGKSNLLEAIGICSSLRSFRGASTQSMVREGDLESSLFARYLDDNGTEREVMISFAPKGSKVVHVDGEPVKRLGDLLGQFPSVCLSSRDFRLVRESPSDRRKWMDLVLSSTSNEYFRALQDYYRSMKERNVLLKKQGSDSELLAFEHTLASSAHLIQQVRSSFFPSLSHTFELSYGRLSSDMERASMAYLPDCQATSIDQWTELFARERGRDRQIGSTRKGPHRDDFSLLLNGHDARHYASEGQQKGVVLSLRLAEFSYLQKKLGMVPILLADDVLGELDSDRRSNFRKLLPPTAQTFATGTAFPSREEEEIWEAFQVSSGNFTILIPSAKDE